MRAEQARDTRRRILAAAEGELLGGGYHATTMTSLARASGVSPQTIYDAIGKKAAVLKAVYDILLVGDDAPIPMSERPEWTRTVTQPTLPATLRAYASMSRLIVSRVGPLVGMALAEGAGADADLASFLAAIDRERRIGASGSGRQRDFPHLLDSLNQASHLRPACSARCSRSAMLKWKVLNTWVRSRGPFRHR